MKEQLEKLVLQMYKNGVRCSEVVREFQKAFAVTVLPEHNANQVKAAKRLSMHRNSLRRHITELEVDVETLRPSRRPPLSERIVREKKKATAT